MFSRELSGKVALVTGASSGIGKATALAFAQAGAKVIVASRRVTEGQQTVRQICEGAGEAFFIKTDVSKAIEVEALLNKTVEIYGRLDFACNNAGVGIVSPLTECSEADWDYIINVNLKGIWLCLKYQIPIMLKLGCGSIVNMSSMCGIVGTAGSSIYSASKGGIVALTKEAAIEYAKSGIRINSVSPGAIKTDIQNNLPTDILSEIVAAHPIGRIGKPEEVADAVLWLCSEKASFITGHNLMIDGGYTAQ
ncbi:MAG: SDR family oxidoreductase [Okeania sp. SIO3C4]|nr:SDR family oxidoreductase [Okeania sp. SIO3C4]